MSRIHIVLPVHNRRRVTAGLVACLARQTDRDFHLLLVDDGSTDGTAAMVRRRLAATTVITGDGRWFWAGAVEAARRWLRQRRPTATDIVLLLNDDARFADDYLATGRRLLAARPGALIGSTCFTASGDRLLDAGIRADLRRLRFGPAAGRPPNCLSTRGLFLGARHFAALGGWHPRLLPHYLSDYAFTLHAAGRGHRLMVAPELRIRLVRPSTHWEVESPGLSTARFLRRLFAPKSVGNPAHRSAFALLACPWPWKVVHPPRIWAAALAHAVRHAAGRVRRGRPR